MVSLMVSLNLHVACPLSPYLFLLVTKGLHAFFKKAEDDGDFMGVSLCLASPQVSHFLFVDDSLIFCRAIVTECVKIQAILFKYEQASG